MKKTLMVTFFLFSTTSFAVADCIDYQKVESNLRQELRARMKGIGMGSPMPESISHPRVSVTSEENNSDNIIRAAIAVDYKFKDDKAASTQVEIYSVNSDCSLKLLPERTEDLVPLEL